MPDTIYKAPQFNFVDAVMVTIAERLGISRILTLDRREFWIMRPRHFISIVLEIENKCYQTLRGINVQFGDGTYASQ